MAEDQVIDAMDEAVPKGGGRRKNLVFGGILLGVMVVEGLVAFVLVKHYGPEPASAEASQTTGLDAGEGEKVREEVEIEVASFRAQNESARQLVMYELVVWVSVDKEHKESVAALVANKQATIKDRLSSVVRSADAEVLSEADPVTLRQRFHEELNAIIGDDEIIRRVLIPSMIPYGS